jgi:predicted NBD/HSP70 family sugar kinase
MGKQQFLKAHNRATLLNAVRKQGAISRADLSRQTGLSVGAVTGLTSELIQDGLIYEKQEGDSRGGRPPILLALQPKGAYVVGSKLTEDHITLALTNLDADVVDRLTISSERSEPQWVAKRIGEGIKQLLHRSDIPHKRLIGVGIGMAGVMDAAHGVCRSSPILGWQNVAFAEMVEQLTSFPVYIDNDVNTLTLVEMLYGRGVGLEHFLTVTIGRGVGLGIVANGQLYRGMGGAGEFGHTVIDPNGARCDCGKRGCLETFVGDPWLLRLAAEEGLPLASPDALVVAAQDGSLTSRDILRRAGQMLGRAVALLVNILNPQLILLSGEGIRYGDWLIGPMRETLQANIMPVLGEGLALHIEPLGDDAWARGAASLVLQEIFRTSESALALAGG